MMASTAKYDIPITNHKDFVTFSQIGGLEDNIKTLKESIIFPLIYPSIYNKFKVKAPRGVLFHGPPGTGKTLVAGALAKECSKGILGDVTFFSRKGADILDKWVGESEQKLRALFTKAAKNRPAIIFFDEIDGLAPKRSSRQDQVHTSVVATLLALMDGMDKLAGVIVIGATNRLDAIDPALRRSGRFDRELYFPLPAMKARKAILEVHTDEWTVKPKPTFISYLADITAGYCGSDLQALCAEAVMACLRRNYPKIHTRSKVNIRMRNLEVQECDFMTARPVIKPSVIRERGVIPRRKLTEIEQPLLQRQFDKIIHALNSKWSHFMQPEFKYNIGTTRYAGRLLLTGQQNQGHNTHLAPAILHAMEHLPYYVIDIQTLFESACQTAEEICVQKLSLAKQNLPSIILTYRVDEWWDVVEESTRAVMISLFESVHAGLPLLILATTTNELPPPMATYFNNRSTIILKMRNANEKERNNFFYPIFMKNAHAKCIEYINNSGEPRGNEDTTFLYQRKASAVPNPETRKRPVADKGQNSEYKRQKVNSASRECHGGHLLNRRSQHTLNREDNINTSNQVDGKHSKAKEIEKKQSGKCVTNKNSSTQTNAWLPFAAYNIVQKIRNSFTNINDSMSEENDNEVHSDTHSIESQTANEEEPERSELHTYNDALLQKLSFLYQRAVVVTSASMTIAQLELLYDMLDTCIKRENQDASTMIKSIENILTDFETKRSDISASSR